jgi:hypothetical protein
MKNDKEMAVILDTFSNDPQLPLMLCTLLQREFCMKSPRRQRKNTSSKVSKRLFSTKLIVKRKKNQSFVYFPSNFLNLRVLKSRLLPQINKVSERDCRTSSSLAQSGIFRKSKNTITARHKFDVLAFVLRMWKRILIGENYECLSPIGRRIF